MVVELDSESLALFCKTKTMGVGRLTMVTISKINSKFARLGISWCGKACAMGTLGTHTPRRREAAERERNSHRRVLCSLAIMLWQATIFTAGRVLHQGPAFWYKVMINMGVMGTHTPRRREAAKRRSGEAAKRLASSTYLVD